MAKLICLQSGHEGRTSGSTGASGEKDANVRIRNRLSQLLIEKGFQVQLVNADPTNAEIDKDFDLFLALHCDADYPNDNGSGFADYPEPSTDDATTESQRICKVINEVYFPETKINYINHSSPNTRYYYMWSRLSAKTACILIEMGQIQDPHDSVLLGNTELIAGALSRAICKAFNVETPTTPPLCPPCPPDLSSEVTALKEELNTAKGEIITLIEEENKLIDKLGEIKSIAEGKGWPWVKINKIKATI